MTAVHYSAAMVVTLERLLPRRLLLKCRVSVWLVCVSLKTIGTPRRRERVPTGEKERKTSLQRQISDLHSSWVPYYCLIMWYVRTVSQMRVINQMCTVTIAYSSLIRIV